MSGNKKNTIEIKPFIRMVLFGSVARPLC
jgi:hypothetical protein